MKRKRLKQRANKVLIFSSLKGEKLSTYILMCLGCFIISFNVAAISAAIPRIGIDLKLPDFEVAKIIPNYMIPYGLGALLYAPLTRYIAYKWTYILMLALYGTACLLCAKAESLNVILICRVAMGISAAGVIPIGLMLIGEYFEKSIRGRLVGFFFSNAFIASIIGLAVGGVLHWRFIFLIPAVLSILMLLLVVFDRSSILRQRHIGHINYLTVLQKPEILKVFVFIFAISFLYHGVHKWYGVYLSRVYAFDNFQINMFVIFTVIAGMFGQLFGGYFSDRKGRYFTARLGVIGLAASIMCLYAIHHPIVLAGILIFISVFWTVGHNGISTVLTDFSNEDRPVIAGLNSSVRFISGGLGFTLSSHFVEISFGKTFFIIGCLILSLFFTLRRVVPQS